jgi:uncharacterized protein (DUF2267 family)
MKNTTGLDVFDTTLHKTNAWLTEIMEALAIDDRHLAYAILSAVLHALRDRLTVAEAVHLGAQLPMLVRGIYYEGWTVAGKPQKTKREDFLDAICKPFPPGAGAAELEGAARAVFGVLARHVSAGEIDDVKHMLPKDLRDLWPQ